MIHLPTLKSLIENGRLQERHPLYSLSKDKSIVLDEAIGIALSKYHENSKGVNSLLGSLCDTKSYQGLLGELFWCYRLKQSGFSFKTESKEGQKDFRIELDNRIVGAEVKTIQKPIVAKQEAGVNKRLKESILKQIDNNQLKCIISVTIKRNLSDKDIKPIAMKTKEFVEQISLSLEKCTFNYPATDKCQAKVTIKPYQGKKHYLLINLPPIMGTDDKLLRRNLRNARRQLDKDGVNVIFVDKTFRPTLVEEDILNILYGRLCHDVYSDKKTKEPISVDTYLWDDGYFKETSRISAVIIYQRNDAHDLSGIRDYEIYPHPEHCILTESELEHFHKLCRV